MRYIQGMIIGGIELRTPGSADAETMIAFMKQSYSETPFLSSMPEEFDVSVEEELEFLRRHERSEKDCMIGAWIGGRLAGTVRLSAVRDNYRLRHRAKVGVSVLKEFWGRGVGSMLMDAALNTAASAGYRQVELEVCADNERAIRLYKKFGFEEYGRLPQAMRRSYDTFMDEILMVKRL